MHAFQHLKFLLLLSRHVYTPPSLFWSRLEGYLFATLECGGAGVSDCYCSLPAHLFHDDCDPMK